MEISQQFAKNFKQKLSKTSNEQYCSKAESSHHRESVVHSSKPVKLKTDKHCNSELVRVRRLKTRKERNQTRGQERGRSQPCPQPNRKEISEKAKHHPMSGSKKERAFAKPLISQNPSIITEGRLTSIKGLFSHEVRSVNIERLMSDQIQQDKQKKNQRTHTMMNITSPLPPVVPDSDQHFVIDDIQEPENNSPPHVKRNSSRKKTSGLIESNREVSVPIGSSLVDGERARTRIEDNNFETNQNSPCSPKEPEFVVLSSSENESVHQLRSTPGEMSKHNSDISRILKSPDDGNRIQRFGETSTSTAVPQIWENLLTSTSERDSGACQLADNDKKGKEMSVSHSKVVKRLVRRLCQASDLYVPSQRCPLLVKGRKTLMQTLQRRHGFQLDHNLHMLRSSFNGKLTATQLSSEQTCKDKDRRYSRNTEIWKDEAIQQDYLSDQAKQHLDRGFSIKKRRIQEWKISSPEFLLKEPQESQVDMFDQWREAQLSQDFFRGPQHPFKPLFNQDQTFIQHASPILEAPTWDDHHINPFSQQQLQTRGESWTNVHLDLSKISQKLREDTDLDSYHFYESMKQKPQDVSFGGSSFWSHQLMVQDKIEKPASFSFSPSYYTEGFQYKPFLRCPRPSNTQHRSECPSMTFCPRSSTPFTLPFSFSEPCLPRSSPHWFN